MTKVVFILETLLGGGAERVTVALASQMAEYDNFEVHLLTCLKTDEDYVLPNKVMRHVMIKSNRGRLRTIEHKYKFFQNEIDKIKPDYVISLATPKTSVLLTLASQNRTYKLILSERNDPNRFPKEWPLKILRNWAYKKCDGVVFQTEGARDYFSNKIRIKSTVIVNPLSENLPSKYLGDREKCIVNFCRFEPQKNLPMLIKAFALISEEYPHYTLNLYGDGSQMEMLKRLSAELRIDSKVRFLGFSNDIHGQIVNSALFVSSSDFEGISNSMLEAMAIGLPTICTDCPAGGARMTIIDGINGVMVPVGDERKLADAMKRVLSDSELADKLSINAAKLKDELTVDKITRKWIDFIKETK